MAAHERAPLRRRLGFKVVVATLKALPGYAEAAEQVFFELRDEFNPAIPPERRALVSPGQDLSVRAAPPRSSV